MSQQQLLKKVVAAMNATNTPYMLTGSMASSLQGEPRSTHDIDLVAAIDILDVPDLVKFFQPPEYYLDEVSVREAVIKKRQFNLIEQSSGDKVDFWLLTDEPFDQQRFARRREVLALGEPIFVSTPEDTILMKLKWAEMCGGSEKQMRDVRSVYRLQKQRLDIEYLRHWSQKLEVSHLLDRLLEQ